MPQFASPGVRIRIWLLLLACFGVPRKARVARKTRWDSWWDERDSALKPTHEICQDLPQNGKPCKTASPGLSTTAPRALQKKKTPTLLGVNMGKQDTTTIMSGKVLNWAPKNSEAPLRKSRTPNFVGQCLVPHAYLPSGSSRTCSANLQDALDETLHQNGETMRNHCLLDIIYSEALIPGCFRQCRISSIRGKVFYTTSHAMLCHRGLPNMDTYQPAKSIGHGLPNTDTLVVLSVSHVVAPEMACCLLVPLEIPMSHVFNIFPDFVFPVFAQLSRLLAKDRLQAWSNPGVHQTYSDVSCWQGTDIRPSDASRDLHLWTMNEPRPKELPPQVCSNLNPKLPDMGLSPSGMSSKVVFPWCSWNRPNKKNNAFHVQGNPGGKNASTFRHAWKRLRVYVQPHPSPP